MKKVTLLVVALLCLPALAATPGIPSVNDSGSHSQSTAITAAKSAPDRDSQAQTRAAYATLPLSFVPNAGQMDPRVRYSAQSGGATFYFTTRDAVFSFASKARGLVLRLGFLGANSQPAITGQTPQSGTVNYLIGNDPARWHTNLPTYGEVVYRDLWPGIDLRFRSENGKLEYEFLLKPGARVQDIRLAYRGADKLSVDRDGELIVHTKVGSITDKRPVTYQLVDGKRVLVTSRFALEQRVSSKTAYGFAVGSYDPSRALVIDPGLVYSTFLGGSGDDSGNAIAVDSAGQAYVAGSTYSVDFPTTTGSFEPTYNGFEDAFVTKLNSSGSNLVYSTYLGGKTNDEPYWSASIAVDCSGNAYVTGTTWSSDFPTTPGAYQRVLKGLEDAYVVKLNSSGNLIYSTYLGGSSFDGAYYGDAIAVDSSGYAYVTGFTDSTDFPHTPGAYQPALHVVEDAFVTKLNTKGTGLVYSTFLGGSDYDDATGIAVDSGGKAYVTGFTYSKDFPYTLGAYQSANKGVANAFITKLNSKGSALVYSTYLGGTGSDAAGSIAVDWSGNAYVTGDAGSPDFPTTPGAFQTAYGGGLDDVFITKLNSSGSNLVYSTYLGGELDDYANNIAIDSAGQAHVTGFTNSTMFPTTADAFSRTYSGTTGPVFFYGDALVTKLNSQGSDLIYSTYLGSTGDDLGLGIAVDRADKIYVTGSTNSMLFPTTPGAFDTKYNGAGPPYFYGDAFVTKLQVSAGAPGCDKADGDGDAQDKSSGKKSHFHFHKRSSCDDPNDKENDNVESDDDSGSHFQSSSVNSSTYSIQDSSQVITLTGTGTHNGLPVSFTMVGVNYGDVAPGIFQITLTDGYVFNGILLDGSINIQ
jgi:hypothetical protein